MRPKAWIDENHVVCIRDDVPLDEAGELYDMLGAAFNAGTANGWTQGWERAISQARVVRMGYRIWVRAFNRWWGIP